ncbi:MAG: HAD hydrolase-like protein [Rickettsiales bacterium]|nr:HAD hydrolase-like protein [Rickettsiales bacterium]
MIGFYALFTLLCLSSARAGTSVHKNLSRLWDRADVIILDAYGVIWNGKNFYENSKELMRDMMRSGKLVYILSNATQLSSESVESFRNKEGGGITPGVHYHRLITSGDFVRSILLDGKLKFKSKSDPKYVYVLGIPNKTLFKGTKYVQVDAPEKADFVYVSVPKLNEEQFNSYPHREYLRESTSHSHGNPDRTWNSIAMDPFIADLKKFRELGLPMLSANPDLTAEEAVSGSSERQFVVRQGAIVREYRKMGGEAVEFGKPDTGIYRIVFDDIRSRNVKVNKSRVLMVGDTIATDIRGAQSAGIKSCLCTETGVTSNEIHKKLEQVVSELNRKQVEHSNREKKIMQAKSRILRELLKRERTKVNYLIEGLSIGYTSPYRGR